MASQYLISVTKTPADLWRMRKQFALQLAANSFMTYTLPLGNRQAQRFMLSRDTGQISMLDIVSCTLHTLRPPCDLILITT